MKGKVLVALFLGLFFVAIGVVVYYMLQAPVNTTNVIPYLHNEGEAQGTTYSVTYQQPNGIDLQKKIETRLLDFNMSLSTYEPKSIISRINSNDTTVRTDIDFETMYKVACEVSALTDGAFDITVGPLVKAWGFGFGNSDHSKIPDLTKILPLVGFHKIKLADHKFYKQNPNILIDANALAQGYSADLIAKLLENNGCKNYMIEIGGEIVCKGLNDKGKKWQIGIDKPIDETLNSTNELDTIVSVTDLAITTSGNYRKFYYLNGKKYAHTIDPRTGFPVVHNLLSATVVAPTCIQADAYATAFMVIGVEASLKLCKSIPNMDCYLIYADKDGKNQIVYTDGFKKYLTQ